MTTKLHAFRGRAALAAVLTLTGSATAGTYTMYEASGSLDSISGDLVESPSLPPLSTGIVLDNGTLRITGSSADDGASVTMTSTAIVASRNGIRASFGLWQVRGIEFYGNGGNDTFINVTTIPCAAYGGDGDDSLTGGGGDDFLVGGLGNDTLLAAEGDDVLWGSGGHDVLGGGTGADRLKGHGGDDDLYGDGGADELYGGSGADELYGGSGIDTLVSIGGGYDRVLGGTSTDYFWIDTDDDLGDASTTETAEAYVNRVAGYYRYSYSGGIESTAVPKDLTDYDLQDPLPLAAGTPLANFADRPLFAGVGPTQADVLQGAGVEDCHILGPLSAVAAQTPDSIRKLVVDLGDGTYAVRMYRTSYTAAEYVRVDADLYVDGDGNPRYAKLGVDGSLWAPIVEKAFAFYRDRLGTYASIADGNAGTSGRLIFRASIDTYEIPALFDSYDVVAWIAAGRPANAVATYIDSTVPTLLNWIADRLDEGRPVYTGYVAKTRNTTELTAGSDGNWRRGRHIIMVERVTFDAGGRPTGLILRDQLGGNWFSFTDRAHIYHVFGRAHTYDMP